MARSHCVSPLALLLPLVAGFFDVQFSKGGHDQSEDSVLRYHGNVYNTIHGVSNDDLEVEIEADDITAAFTMGGLPVGEPTDLLGDTIVFNGTVYTTASGGAQHARHASLLTGKRFRASSAVIIPKGLKPTVVGELQVARKGIRVSLFAAISRITMKLAQPICFIAKLRVNYFKGHALEKAPIYNENLHDEGYLSVAPARGQTEPHYAVAAGCASNPQYVFDEELRRKLGFILPSTANLYENPQERKLLTHVEALQVSETLDLTDAEILAPEKPDGVYHTSTVTSLVSGQFNIYVIDDLREYGTEEDGEAEEAEMDTETIFSETGSCEAEGECGVDGGREKDEL
ncbi:hypothetical protein AAMO2058_001560500 [Amorphochlora amoebiformis]|uniref:Uncharacterized protein n=1 Tax=Amorphochlora amoebiformis TaxID=1561963 RepID=A0A7S0H2U0_9EUKA|eukprot:1332295-Amorphochlora_amoeboformis.AAC.2